MLTWAEKWVLHARQTSEGRRKGRRRSAQEGIARRFALRGAWGGYLSLGASGAVAVYSGQVPDATPGRTDRGPQDQGSTMMVPSTPGPYPSTLKG